jgi:hypothetical protein
MDRFMKKHFHLLFTNQYGLETIVKEFIETLNTKISGSGKEIKPS